MARGQGSRLYPLTQSVCKPALPFGASHRIIDFVLSNLQHAQLDSITILAPPNADTLSTHIQKHWSNVHYIPSASGHSRVGNGMSVYQALSTLPKDTEIVGIFPSDHILNIDIHQTWLQHCQSNHSASILCMPHQRTNNMPFGVLHSQNNTIVDFIEKPSIVPTEWTINNQCFISMGIYWFARETLLSILTEDSKNPDSSHDFGTDIIPMLIRQTEIQAIRIDPQTPWEDVGTIDQYWSAHWCFTPEVLEEWSICKTSREFMFHQSPNGSSLYSKSLIPPTTTVYKSIILSNVIIGKCCHIEHILIDEDCIVEDGVILTPTTIFEGPVLNATQCVVIPRNSRVYNDIHSNKVIVGPR